MPKAMTFGAARTGYLEVVRGSPAQQAFKSKVNTANASGVEEFNEGEWAILDANLEANKYSSGSAETRVWPVVTGKERTDVYGGGSVTLLVGTGYHLRTSGYKTTGTYAYGTLLTVKSGLLEPAASGEQVHAMALGAAKTLKTDAEKALGKAGFTVIEVEVISMGKA